MQIKKLLVPFMSLISLFTLNSVFSDENSKHAPITNELIVMLEHNPNLKKLLLKSIDSAKKINPDKVTNPAQTLEEYYDFIDWASTSLPWEIEKRATYSSLFDQIDQGLGYFYFMNDQPLEELKNKGYYNNSLQYHEPYRSWMINFINQWGAFLSTPASWQEEYYQKALADKHFGLQNGWYEDHSNWKSFNDFFARYLKAPDMRPIAAQNDDTIVVSPADSVPQGMWDIDASSNIKLNGVRIKSKKFTSVAHLIGPNSVYTQAFANGKLTHTFLNVDDYHRYHFPMSGVIKEVQVIQADDAVGGITGWDAQSKKYVLESKIPSWESIETRGCVILETEKYGLVALLPIGMSQVSSVNFEKTVKVGAKVKKGDMLGYFLFGGSDFVMVFQKQAHFKLTVPQKSGVYPHLLMGEKYGVVNHQAQ